MRAIINRTKLCELLCKGTYNSVKCQKQYTKEMRKSGLRIEKLGEKTFQRETEKISFEQWLNESYLTVISTWRYALCYLKWFILWYQRYKDHWIENNANRSEDFAVKRKIADKKQTLTRTKGNGKMENVCDDGLVEWAN